MRSLQLGFAGVRPNEQEQRLSRGAGPLSCGFEMWAFFLTAFCPEEEVTSHLEQGRVVAQHHLPGDCLDKSQAIVRPKRHPVGDHAIESHVRRRCGFRM